MTIIQHNVKLAFLLSSLVWNFSAPVQADSVKLLNTTNNHTYQRFDSSQTWIQAKNSCITQGGYLVTITSQAENDWLNLSLVNGIPSALWLGASGGLTTGLWQWITGEAWSYNNLNNTLASSDYIRIYGNNSYSNGMWTSSLGGTTSGYICEWNRAFQTTTGMIIGDTNNNGSTEFILVGNNGAINKVFSYDRVSKAVVSNVNFLPYPAYNGVNLNVVDDMNGNGYKEFALLMTKKADGSSVIQTRDSKTGVLIETYNVPR